MYGKAYSRRLPFNLLITVAGLAYIFIMFNLLFVRDRYFGSGYSYNIVPFDTIKNYIYQFHHYNLDIVVKNLLGNIVLFIPIGIIAPLLNKRLLKVIPLLSFTVVLIVGVELAQMLLRVGSFDIDDVILNTLGALIGLILTRITIATVR